MGVINRDVRSYEGTSVKIRDEINLAEENVTRKYYKIRDWRSVSVSITSNRAGLAGNVRIGQTMLPQEEIQELNQGVVNLELTDQGTAYQWGVDVAGDYVGLDFSAATLPVDGKLIIIVLAKRV